jgi:hypothetical protein
VTWLSAVPVALLTAAWVLVPGLPLTYALGLRGVSAWGVAPAASIGSVAVGAVVAGLAGFPWSPVAALAPAVLLATAVAAGRWAVHRRRPPRMRPGEDGWRPATGSAVGTAGAFTLGWLTAQQGMGRPDAISQTYDAVFHYNAVARVLEQRNGSSLVVGTLTDPSAETAFYPAAWHDLVSLVVLSGGGSLPVATNMLALVVAALVWPLACLALVRQLAGRSVAAAVITPLVSVGFIAFPWSLLTFGVLWPNLLGLALVPVGLAAVVTLCGMTEDGAMNRWQALAVGVIAVVALGLAHPNAVFSLGALAIVPLALAFAGWLRARVRAGAWISAAGWLAVVTAATAGVAVFLATSPLLAAVRAFDWAAFQSPPQAAGEVLLNATNGKDAAWGISLVVVIGVVAAWRTPHARWLIPAHLVSGGLYLLASSLETPLAALVTGFWYNDSYRLAAMVPITGVPLAVLGLLLLGTRVAAHVRLPARAGGATTDRASGTRRAIGAVAAALVLVAATSGLYVRDHAEYLAVAYPPGAGLVDSHEREFFNRIAALIPPDAVVAQNPWSGSSLLWALTGRRVLFPHMAGTWTPAQRYLAQHFNDAATDRRACAVAEQLGVRYLLVGEVTFWPWDPRSKQYPGLTAPQPGSGFELVASDGHGNKLYRLTACGAATDDA